MEEYRQRRQELEQRLMALDQQHRLVEAQTRQQLEVSGICEALTDFCQRVQAGLAEATFDEMRQLVELLIDRVVVTMDEVEIRYVIPTSPRSEHIRFCHLHTDYFHALAVALHIYHDPFNDLANDLFALSSHGSRGSPERGNIRRQAANSFPLGECSDAGLVLDKSMILLLKLRLRG
jgi:site-specific DNA recombinase